MATAAPTIPAPSFQTAFAAYSAAVALRDLCHADEDIDRAEDAIQPLFEAVVSHPARDLSAVISKCSAIVTEFGTGEVSGRLVEGILFDLIALERGQ